MDLDLLPIGWVHFVASLIAIGIAALVLLQPKGTPVHRLRGRAYVLAVLVTSITALGITRLGYFFFPHWFAIAALIAITVGFAAAHFKRPRSAWVHVHLTSMLVSCYILIGGGVNEVFLRIDALRKLAPRVDSPVVGWTHFTVMLVFAALIVAFNVAARKRSRAADAALADPPHTGARTSLT